MWYILAYLITIALANVVTAATTPLKLWIFIIPWGSFFIGAIFVLRDLVQMKYNRRIAYEAIVVGLILSAIVSYLLHDPLWIVVASALTFAVSETSDTEIFSRLHLPPQIRVWWSGLVSGVLDSSIFVVVGLSPLGAGFIPWEAVPAAIVGQIITKTFMCGIGYIIIKHLYRCQRCRFARFISIPLSCSCGHGDAARRGGPCADFRIR